MPAILLLAAAFLEVQQPATPRPACAWGEVTVRRVHDLDGRRDIAPLLVATPAGCQLYVELPPSSTRLQLHLESQRTISEVTLPGSEEALDFAPVGRFTRVHLPLDRERSQILPLRIALQSDDEEAEDGASGLAASEAVVSLYVVRRPRLRVVSSKDCASETVCLEDSRTVRVMLEGEAIDEVRIGPQAAYTVNGKTTFTRSVVREGDQLAIDFPVIALAPGTQRIVLHTKQPAYRLARASWEADSAVVVDATIVQRQPRTPELREEVEPGRPGIPGVVMVGDTRSMSLAGITPTTLTTATMYGLFQGLDGGGKQVGWLHVNEIRGDIARVSISATAPTVRAPTRGEPPHLLIMRDKALVAHAHLQFVSVPRIDSVWVEHEIAAYRDNQVRPGEKVTLHVVGDALAAFDTADYVTGDGKVIRQETRMKSDREMVLDLQIASNARSVVPVVLRSQVTAPTTVGLNVVLPLRPRQLDFVDMSWRTSRWGVRPADTTAAIVWGSPVTQVNSPHVDGLALRVASDRLDKKGTEYGPQYLIVDARFVSPEGVQVARDSTMIVVVPDGAHGYSLSEGYQQRRDVRIDDLLKRMPRNAQPGSYVEVVVRHDPRRYSGIPGDEFTIRLQDRSRWRITPRFDLLTGISYFAPNRTLNVTRAVEPNGAGADTIIRRSTEKRWVSDFLDITGGASAAIDIAVMRSDFKPSLARVRLAIMALSEPFSEQRNRGFGVAFLYPVELLDIHGSVSLSLAAGYGWQLGGRGFGMIAPGVGFSLPKP